MNAQLYFFIFFFSVTSENAIAVESMTSASTTGGVAKMVLGLLVVLGVMALATWAIKRMMPGASGQQSVIRIVGGASVGTRERVVVLEVAGRWLVVGVAPGQVNAIANLEIDHNLSDPTSLNISMSNQVASENAVSPSMASAFGKMLKKSAESLTGRANEKS